MATSKSKVDDRPILEQIALQREEAASKALSDMMRLTFLMNGGALIALLTFAGALVQKGIPVPEGIATAFIFFFFGLALVTLAGLALASEAEVLFDDALINLQRGFLPTHTVKVLTTRTFIGMMAAGGVALAIVGFMSATGGMDDLTGAPACPPAQTWCNAPVVSPQAAPQN